MSKIFLIDLCACVEITVARGGRERAPCFAAHLAYFINKLQLLNEAAVCRQSNCTHGAVVPVTGAGRRRRRPREEEEAACRFPGLASSMPRRLLVCGPSLNRRVASSARSPLLPSLVFAFSCVKKHLAKSLWPSSALISSFFKPNPPFPSIPYEPRASESHRWF